MVSTWYIDFLVERIRHPKGTVCICILLFICYFFLTSYLILSYGGPLFQGVILNIMTNRLKSMLFSFLYALKNTVQLPGLWVSDRPEGFVPYIWCWVHGYWRQKWLISHYTDPNQNVLVSCWPNCALSWLSPFFKSDWSAAKKAPFFSLCRLHIPISHKAHAE